MSILDGAHGVLERFKQEMPQELYDSWLTPIEIIDVDNSKLILEMPNQLHLDWFKKNYFNRFSELLMQYEGIHVQVDLTISKVDRAKELLHTTAPILPPTQPPVSRMPQDLFLNPSYIFDNFVVGSSNRFAHAAAFAVAQSPGKTYNPLFLYGGVGLGKTHLMQALGHYIHQANPSSKVFYTSMESFTNELINAIQNGNTLKFRSKFRGVDVLLIDDVHFLGGKEHTQEEFFHTFNTLYDARKQIVLSSDRPPKEIANLEERLVSRFEWGLVTDLQPPDYETRIAILQKKCELSSLIVPKEILLYIAENIKTNIRKLEGALIRVISSATLTGEPLTFSLAEKVLQDLIIDTTETIISIDLIQKIVTDYFDIRVADMKSKKRPKSIAYPRQIAMYLARELTTHSLPEIGEAFGGRDHTTVIHACKSIDHNLQSDYNLKRIITMLNQRIANRK